MASIELLGAGGVERVVRVESGAFVVGREGADLVIGDDPLISDRHATLRYDAEAERWELVDERSATGTWARLERPALVRPGGMVVVGRQRLYLGSEEEEWVVFHHDARDRRLATYPLHEGVTIFGRCAPVTLADDDRALSRRHVAFVRKGDLVEVRDLRSANGTLLRLASPFAVQDGDRFVIGRSLLTFRSGAPATGETPPEAVFVESADLGSEPEVAEPAAVVATVTFEGYGTFPVRGSETLLEVAEANDIPIDYSCRAGRCGADPIDILSGHENIGPAESDEREVLETMCGVGPGELCRLACRSRVRGPVVCRLREI